MEDFVADGTTIAIEETSEIPKQPPCPETYSIGYQRFNL